VGKPRRVVDPDAALFAPKRVPFAFVLDELAPLGPHTKPMFGCTAVYVGERIVLVLRDRPVHPDDNGVWIATTREHHASLRAELPCMRSIAALANGGETGWQNLPSDHPDFEEAVLRVCALIASADPRIGKVPKRKPPRSARPLSRAGPAAVRKSRASGVAAKGAARAARRTKPRR
jgi:hypothetical protein